MFSWPWWNAKSCLSINKTLSLVFSLLIVTLWRVRIIKRLHCVVSIGRWRFFYSSNFIFIREAGRILIDFWVHVLGLFVNFRIDIFINCRWSLICNITLLNYESRSFLIGFDCSSDSLSSIFPSLHIMVHLRWRRWLFRTLIMFDYSVKVTVYWTIHHFLSVHRLLLRPVISCIIFRWTWHILGNFGNCCNESISFRLLLFPCLDRN